MKSDTGWASLFTVKTRTCLRDLREKWILKKQNNLITGEGVTTQGSNENNSKPSATSTQGVTSESDTAISNPSQDSRPAIDTTDTDPVACRWSARRSPLASSRGSDCIVYSLSLYSLLATCSCLDAKSSRR